MTLHRHPQAALPLPQINFFRWRGRLCCSRLRLLPRISRPWHLLPSRRPGRTSLRRPCCCPRRCLCNHCRHRLHLLPGIRRDYRWRRRRLRAHSSWEGSHYSKTPPRRLRLPPLHRRLLPGIRQCSNHSGGTSSPSSSPLMRLNLPLPLPLPLSPNPLPISLGAAAAATSSTFSLRCTNQRMMMLQLRL